MDENDQDKTINNPVTAENKLWLPPSYTNGNTSIATGETSSPKKTVNRWGLSGKTGWDWLNLIGVLAIPFVIAAGTLFFTQQITQQQALFSKQQHQTDMQIAQDQQRENVLVDYQKDISDLLLLYKLRSSKAGDEVREIARTKTLISLRKLNPDRKTLLIQFLYESQLISLNNPIISLKGADLSNINLNTSPPDIAPILTYLTGINLSYAYLPNTILGYCDLRESYLNHALMFHTISLFTSLENAKLVFADLDYAILSETKLSHADLNHAQLNYVKLT